jgi:hypothetical protein
LSAWPGRNPAGRKEITMMYSYGHGIGGGWGYGLTAIIMVLFWGR